MSQSSQNSQSGAVSLFVVIFSALLLSVITISFIRIMNQEQQSALSNDLSQSAYDSAQAGVEDAKRVLLAYQEGNTRARAAVDSRECDTVARSGIVGESTTTVNRETMIQRTSELDNELDQAYTCVIINMATNDYLAQLQADQSILVPLRSQSAISQIRISWMLQAKDSVSVKDAEAALNRLTEFKNGLPNREGWGERAPALLRAQVIAPIAPFTLDNLDESEVTQAVYLYPVRPSMTGTATDNEIDLGLMSRRVAGQNEPMRTVCSPAAYKEGQYLCSTTLKLAREIPANSNVAQLRLGAIYQKSAVRIELGNSAGGLVQFDGVQPMVDSTGRANDVFRRVESRLSVGLSNFAYPDAAVDINGSLCKDFYVTDSEAGGASCKP